MHGLRVESWRDLLEIYDRELAVVEGQMRLMFTAHAGFHAFQAICGAGPVMAAIFYAEIAMSVVSRRPGICARGHG